jgi:hypothetical protein
VLSRHPDGLQRLSKQCRLLKSNSLLNTDWPSVRTMLVWRKDGFIVICWTLRSVWTPSKARPDDCIGTGCFCLGFCKESSWTSLSRLWSVIVFDLIIVWIHEDSELKTDHPIKMQPLHKVFLFYPECSQYKVLKLWFVYFLYTWRFWIWEPTILLNRNHYIKCFLKNWNDF